MNTSSDSSDATDKATVRQSRAVESLKFVIVVSRHGNRGTLVQIPNDPYPINNTKFWPYGGGGLTPQGRIQMFNLGAKIRSLYNGFLDSRYDTKDFYASSTAIDRSLLSGEAFLAGLYPPTAKQPWEQKFPSQLIPLYSNSLDKTLEAEFCRKVLSIRNTTLSKFGEEHAEVLSGLNQYLNEYTGTNVSGITGFFATWDTIICEATEGLELPTWMQQIFPHPILDIANDYYVQFVAGSANLVSIIMGDFYQELIGVLKNKVEGKLSPDRKMVFYSGHDFTLITLQAILGIPKASIVGVARPGSAMIFELHQHPDSEEFLIQISRHGNRPGFLTFPNDPFPNNDTKLWPYGHNGDISSFGRIQMFNLGVKIRSLYNGFIDSLYNPEDIFAASTPIDRTVISGQAFVAGLYPPTGRQLWNKYIPSQLVPVYSTSPDKSLIISKCQMVDNLRKISIEKWDKENANQLNSIYSNIAKFVGFNATNMNDFYAIWDSLVSAETEGFSLPNWTKQVYPEPMGELFKKLVVDYCAGSDGMVRLITGLLFKEIIEAMRKKLSALLSPNRKMFYYSGHDYTLMSLQYIFGIPKGSIIGIIKPGSALVIELHEDPSTADATVQLLYIDGSSSDLTPNPLPTPRCGTPCSFQQLANSTYKFTDINNFEEECKITQHFNKI